jgi:hypothetical protein
MLSFRPAFLREPGQECKQRAKADSNNISDCRTRTCAYGGIGGVATSHSTRCPNAPGAPRRYADCIIQGGSLVNLPRVGVCELCKMTRLCRMDRRGYSTQYELDRWGWLAHAVLDTLSSVEAAEVGNPSLPNPGRARHVFDCFLWTASNRQLKANRSLQDCLAGRFQCEVRRFRAVAIRPVWGSVLRAGGSNGCGWRQHQQARVG